MEVLTFEHGEVRLDNELVPGILQNLRVSGKVRFDEQKVDGGSGKKKAPQAEKSRRAPLFQAPHGGSL